MLANRFGAFIVSYVESSVLRICHFGFLDIIQDLVFLVRALSAGATLNVIKESRNG